MAPRSRTHRAKAVASRTIPDSLTSSQTIARVECHLGRMRYALRLPNGKDVVGALDERFRNTIWVGRQGFVLFERYAADKQEQEQEQKQEKQKQKGIHAEGEIINFIKDEKEEKEWRRMPYWPKEFPIPQYFDPDSEDESDVTGKMPPSDSEEE